MTDNYNHIARWLFYNLIPRNIVLFNKQKIQYNINEFKCNSQPNVALNGLQAFRNAELNKYTAI